MLGKLSFAAAIFGAVAFSVAAAAPLGPQSDADTGDGAVSLVKRGRGGKAGAARTAPARTAPASIIITVTAAAATSISGSAFAP